MFKTEGIILKKEYIRDTQTRVIILTKEYGKVSCWYNKKQFLYDIGDIIFLTVERNNSTNTIKYTESIASPRESTWTYEKIKIFLESIALMNTLIPEMSPHAHIFQDYKWLLEFMQRIDTLHEHHYLLFQFRMLRTLGYVWSESFSDAPIPLYIFHNVLRTPLNQLLWAKILKTNDALLIQNTNLEAIYRSIL